jgi:hypothetical protein
MGKFKGRKASNQKEKKVVKKTSVLLRKEKRKEQRKQVKENRMKSFLRRHGKVPVTPQQEVQKLKEENVKHDEKKIKGPSKAEKLAKEQRKQRKKQMLQANIVRLSLFTTRKFHFLRNLIVFFTLSRMRKNRLRN